MKYVVIGAGASGLVSAINLRRKNNEVILLEKNDKCGKKILTTGNGRCNYYNSDQDLKHYHSTNNSLISEIINDKTNNMVLDFFDSIGIIPRIKDGYYYPYSNTAISIQNTLVEEAKKIGVKIITNCYVKDIEKKEDFFNIITNEDYIKCDKVVVSVGSSASLREEVNMYKILEKLGHTVIKQYPALTRLNLDVKYLKEWSGIRNNASVKILVNDKLIREEYGEVLYTNNGLSGICIMQLSNIAAQELDKNNKVEVVINNLYDFCKTRNDFIEFMDERNSKLQNRNISELLDTIINYKLVNILIREARININAKWNSLSDRDKNVLASYFVDFRLNIISTDDISKAQTVSGGVSLLEINPSNMESKLVNGLYLTGEVIDLFGDCGGYNLTISWTTGLLVGEADD